MNQHPQHHPFSAVPNRSGRSAVPIDEGDDAYGYFREHDPA
jgi:hypothetical protein